MTKPVASPSRTILVFDTTGRDQTAVALVANDKVKKIISPVRAQDLQKLTIELLESNDIALESIETIAVLTGPGSYTGTRIGIVAANTLGWLLGKPLIEIEGSSLEEAIELLKYSSLPTVKEVKVRY